MAEPKIAPLRRLQVADHLRPDRRRDDHAARDLRRRRRTSTGSSSGPLKAGATWSSGALRTAASSDVTPAGYNARTTVHEYGGGSYFVSDGVVYFSNFDDQRLYRQRPGADPAAADARRRPLRRWRHGREAAPHHLRPGGPPRRLPRGRQHDRQPRRDEKGGEGDVLVEGNDFYSNPRLSADGSKLAWLAWNHPNMPWDGTEFRVAEIRDDGTLRRGAGSWPAGAKSRSSSRNGCRTARCIFVSRPHRLVEPLPLERRRGPAAMGDGVGVRAAAVGLRDAHLRRDARRPPVCSYDDGDVTKLAVLDPDTG